MSWTVTVRNPMNTTTLVTAVNGLVSGEVAIRGFDPPIVTPPGDCKVMNLYARQDRLTVPPRAIVQLLIDDTPIFWGPAFIVGHSDAPGAGPFNRDRDAIERVTVLGGTKLLEESITGPLLIETNTEVAEVAHQVCELYAHAALTVDVANFPSTGGVLSAFYRPEGRLIDSLSTIAQTVPGGATFWVDAEGAVHFEANWPAGS